MNDLFTLWRSLHSAPFHFSMSENIWADSLYSDTDSDGRRLFDELILRSTEHGMIQYGRTAFAFDQDGQISDAVHYPVVRFLCYDPDYPQEGQELLKEAMGYFTDRERIYAFFHYFGLSACARHGKLHEKDVHVENLLLENGFTVEHENVYFARTLTSDDCGDSSLTIRWQPASPGDCQEFAAVLEEAEIGWGQVHFLPQKDIAYLRWIFIDTTRQNQGLGTATMQALFSSLYESGIRRFDTDTALDNKIAQRLYEKTGFHNEGITRSYFKK